MVRRGAISGCNLYGRGGDSGGRAQVLTSAEAAPDGPAIILVEPQMGENIGAVARAMGNFGLRELRLVAPRDGWPNPRAEAMASGADGVLEAARLYDDTPSAVTDLQAVFATTARSRDLPKPVLTPRQCARELRSLVGSGTRVGLLFGPERTGLDNETMNLAGALVEIPANPEFRSLNLAQAAVVLCYEWWREADETPDVQPVEAPASRDEIGYLYGHLVEELESAGFFHPPDKAPATKAVLRNLLHRAPWTSSEVRLLRGVVHALARRETRP